MNWAAIAYAIQQIGGYTMGLWSNKEAARRNEIYAENQYYYQTQLQQNAQNFMEKMSNTAHQREMADLRAAGLNPLLTANNGASTPTSSAGSVGLQDASAEVAERNNKITAALQFQQLAQNEKSIANERMLKLAQSKNLDTANWTERTQQALNIANALYTEEKRISQMKENSTYETRLMHNLQLIRTQILEGLANTAKMYNDIDMSKLNYNLVASANEYEIRKKQAETNKINAEIPKTYAEMEKIWEETRGINQINNLRNPEFIKNLILAGVTVYFLKGKKVPDKIIQQAQNLIKVVPKHIPY